MPDKPSGEKSEKATPRRIKKARQDGSIGHSKEVGSWASLLAASFVIPAVLKSLMAVAVTGMGYVSATIQQPDTGTALADARSTILHGCESLIPLAALVMVTSVASSAVQGGIHVAPKIFMPKFSRLNPIKGIKHSFGPQGLWELAKSLMKIAVLAAITYFSLRNLIPTLATAGAMPLQAVVNSTTGTALSLIRFTSVAGLVFAGVDMAVVRRRNNKQLKMTKQEVKEENKTQEGSQQLKSAIRSKALQLSRNRMMADVPEADVIVVNPTHVAVALKYDPDKGAPRVVAKGADHVATRIRELANEHRVPMVQDIPLARTLYKTCEVGHEIPADLYQGVATVLAFVMRLRRKGSAAGMHRMTR